VVRTRSYKFIHLCASQIKRIQSTAFAVNPSKGAEMEKLLGRVQSTPLAETLAGAMILAVGMGFGRFSFTGMYPLMVKDAVIDVATGSLAASTNYAGYLLGAILAARFKHAHAAKLSQFSMVATVACLAALSLHVGPWSVIVIRFIAGAVSAIAMVAASIWLFHVIGHHHGAPVLYAGVGLGIVVSAEIIAGGTYGGFNSTALWALLAAASLILSALAWPRITGTGFDPAPPSDTHSHASAAKPDRSAAIVLVAVYGLAGLGYIVTATYLPLLVKDALPGVNPVHVWAAFGLGAAPSCFLWHWLHHRLGSRAAMTLNLLAQAVGVILPVLDASAPMFLASALLVGGTFVGTVTIAMSVARRLGSAVKFNMMATMTAAYGVGQILGPLVANSLFARTHSFNQPLEVASVALVIAAALACR
jgi:MFS family permease